MLKQVVVDKVMARQLWKLGFREPTLSYYDLDGELQTAEGEELILKDYNAPKETRGRGARCYSAPTLSAVQDWLRRKKHLELLICRDTFFQNTGDYYCRLIRLSDGLNCTAFFKIQLTTLRVPNSIHRRAESSSYDHPPLFRRSHGR